MVISNSSNRLVNPDGAGNRPIRGIHITQGGIIVHLRGFGFAKVFQTASQDGSSDTGQRMI
jgi:putative transposase